MGTFLTVFLLVVGLIVVIGVVMGLQTAKRQRAMTASATYMQSDFDATQSLMGIDGRTGVAVDDRRAKLCLLEYQGSRPQSRILSHRDLVAVEVFEDGETVTATKRGSQLGGAIVGGLALGGVGAVIGGLSGTTRSRTKVRTVELRLTVNDPARPVHSVCLLVGNGVEKTSWFYRDASEKARHWHGVLSVLMKRAEPGARPTPAVTSGSVADEIAKLAALRDSGALTTEEFEGQKRRLLNG